MEFPHSRQNKPSYSILLLLKNSVKTDEMTEHQKQSVAKGKDKAEKQTK